MRVQKIDPETLAILEQFQEHRLQLLEQVYYSMSAIPGEAGPYAQYISGYTTALEHLGRRVSHVLTHETMKRNLTIPD